MATSTQYTCDHCRTPKGRGNHWFCLDITRHVLRIIDWPSGHHLPGVLHLCGEECLHAEVSSAIAAGRGEHVFGRRPAAEQVQFESIELRESA